MLSAVYLSLALAVFARPLRAQVDGAQLKAVVETLTRKEFLSSTTEPYRTILAGLIRTSGLRLKLNVNGPAQADAVNFYLLAPETRQRLDVPLAFYSSPGRKLLNNCNYVGLENIIICSQGAMEEFFDNHLRNEVDVHYANGAVDKPGHVSLSVQTGQRAFLYWVLGHELGHLVHGDLDSNFGKEDALQGLAPVDELQQERELRADAYCAQQAAKRKRAQGLVSLTILEQVLISLANDEVRLSKLTQGQGPGLLMHYSQEEKIPYTTQGDHPEYVIRSTRMLRVLARLTKDEALQAMAESFASHLQSTSVPNKP